VPGSQLGPVIDADAHERLRDAVSRARDVGSVVLDRRDVPDRGWFVGPVVVRDVDPDSWLATEELFGPVLATFRARDFESALELANDTDYALTAGLFSRSEHHTRFGSQRLRAGNVYVNRPITGAVVGRQPFGGSGMSGVSSKAGGPDYLLQFLDPQVVSENTIRQGFAPDLPAVGARGETQPPPGPRTKASRSGGAGVADRGGARGVARGRGSPLVVHVRNDEPRSRRPVEVPPGPIHDDHDAVSEADQIDEM